MGLSRSTPRPVRGARPPEQRPRAPGRYTVPVPGPPEVVMGLAIVPVHRPLDHVQPQRGRVPVQRQLQVVRDPADVVDPVQPHVRRDLRHRLRPRQRRDRRLVTVPTKQTLRRNLQHPPQLLRGLVDQVARTGRRDLQHLAVRIGEVDAREVAPVVRTRHRHTRVRQAPLPLQLRVLRLHTERHVMHTPDTPGTPPGRRPLEERQQRPRPTRLVPEIQVVRLRIIEIHRPLHQPQPQQLSVERHRPARVRRDHRHVMEPRRPERHRSLPGLSHHRDNTPGRPEVPPGGMAAGRDRRRAERAAGRPGRALGDAGGGAGVNPSRRGPTPAPRRGLRECPRFRHRFPAAHRRG